MRILIKGEPRTKKNSQQIIQVVRGGKTVPGLIQSNQYRGYEEACLWQIPMECKQIICMPVNVKCLYFMSTRRRVDLSNLLEATDDILVKARVLDDDKCSIIAGHDGSRVYYDKDNPRVEIEITPLDWSWEG